MGIYGSSWWDLHVEFAKKIRSQVVSDLTTDVLAALNKGL